MDLLLGTLVLRPYVFAFLVAYLASAIRDLGPARTIVFGACVWPVAWLAEWSSTRTGVPFGFYHYTGATRGQELFVDNVPFFDSLSFVFLAYAALCVARWALGTTGRPLLAAAAGVLMMLLDVVIDPLAVRGDRWFLGHVFSYAEPGAYFGVPLANFAGWVVVGVVGVGLYLAVAGLPPARRVGPGTALYYAVLAFNLVLTAGIGEWALAACGTALHAALGGGLVGLRRRTARDLTAKGFARA